MAKVLEFMTKYKPLTTYLQNVKSNENELYLTFNKIERIIGTKLPNSAYQYRAWWSNPTSPFDHPHAQSWLQAGWMVDRVDFDHQHVCFRRRTSLSSIKFEGEQNYSVHKADYQADTSTNDTFLHNRVIEDLELLLKIGFEKVGRWYLDQDSLNFQLDKYGNKSNILYAFIVQQNVKYIGKSTLELSKRMNGYKNPGLSQSTNIKINSKIKEYLQNGVGVEIYAFIPKSIELFYEGILVSIAAGLEDNLLTCIKPEWNDRK